MQQYLLGFDVGSSSVKASIVEVESGKTIASAQSPAEEMPMLALRPGWAEQDPEVWWQHVVACTRMCLSRSGVAPDLIRAIGISYQMHGLVCVDRDRQVIRPSIIWCDSRAVSIGEDANDKLGNEYCLEHFLNSPGNFTASKLRWVRQNEPEKFGRIDRVMLPGDFIAMKLSGEIHTTETGLSEGIFWDFSRRDVATRLLAEYEIPATMLADRVPVFSVQSRVNSAAAAELGLRAGTPISYRAGDQPNNAFSLNVLHPGETAATAGTSGVIYSVTEANAFDERSRVNTFIHVNNNAAATRNGVLLCVNGTGILNSWLRKTLGAGAGALSYAAMNDIASSAPIGADGLRILPFGNGAERVLENRDIGATFGGLNFNRHSTGHMLRAAQEGIVFALRYGFDVLREMGLQSRVIRAGHANMFLSPLFREALVNTIGVRVELYDTDGAKGAALGAGVGAGIYGSFEEAFRGLHLIGAQDPDPARGALYNEAYADWKRRLDLAMESSSH